MDNKAMALTVNTFDDLLNMNADMHDMLMCHCMHSIQTAGFLPALGHTHVIL